MKKAFTLIEILVVVAIIALLAAILFPVFSRARENGRRASCQSNLKQIALGIAQYTQDYDERFPMVFGTGSAIPGPYGWADAVQPYIKSLQIYQCPSDSRAPTSNPSIGDSPDDEAGYIDYFYNWAMQSREGTFTSSGACYLPVVWKDSITLSELERASQTVLVMDGVSGSAWNGTQGSTDPGMAYLSRAQGSAVRRHLGGSNVAFADGHVKWFHDADQGDQSAAIYSVCNTFAQSGDSPTFHFKDFK